jgi:hypothetical protein
MLTSNRALLCGSLLAGLGASIPAILIVVGVSVLFSSDGPPWANLVRFAATAVAIGVGSGALVGFPMLALLRFTNSLNTTSAAVAGAVAGFGIALVVFESWAPFATATALGSIVGGVCGAFALRVANAIMMRPNKSLERTRVK